MMVPLDRAMTNFCRMPIVTTSPLDRAMTNFCRMPIVTTSPSTAVWPQF